jgi:hypothetical protein
MRAMPKARKAAAHGTSRTQWCGRKQLKCFSSTCQHPVSWAACSRVSWRQGLARPARDGWANCSPMANASRLAADLPRGYKHYLFDAGARHDRVQEITNEAAVKLPATRSPVIRNAPSNAHHSISADISHPSAATVVLRTSLVSVIAIRHTVLHSLYETYLTIGRHELWINVRFIICHAATNGYLID